MSTYIGGRIIPKHAGTWDETAEYETLTVVLDEETGDSYISRKAVPAGTALDDEEYWAKCSDYSVQLKNIQDAVDVLEAQVAANVTASTDEDADYAAEVVDARVDARGDTYESLGEAVRSIPYGLTEKCIPDATAVAKNYDNTASISVDGGACDCSLYFEGTGYAGVFAGFFGPYDECRDKKFRVFILGSSEVSLQAIVTNKCGSWGSTDGTVGSVSIQTVKLTEDNKYFCAVTLDFSEDKWAEFLESYTYSSTLYFCLRCPDGVTVDTSFSIYAYELKPGRNSSWKYVSGEDDLYLFENELSDARGDYDTLAERLNAQEEALDNDLAERTEELENKIEEQAEILEEVTDAHTDTRGYEYDSLSDRLSMLDAVTCPRLPVSLKVAPRDNKNGTISAGDTGVQIVNNNAIFDFESVAYTEAYDTVDWSSLNFSFAISNAVAAEVSDKGSLYLDLMLGDADGDTAHDGESMTLYFYVNGYQSWGTTINARTSAAITIGEHNLCQLDEAMVEAVLESGLPLYIVFYGASLKTDTITDMDHIRLVASIVDMSDADGYYAGIGRCDYAETAVYADTAGSASVAETAVSAETADEADYAETAGVADNFFLGSPEDLLNEEGVRYSEGMDSLDIPDPPYTFKCSSQSTISFSSSITGSGFEKKVEMDITLSASSSQTSNQGYKKGLSGLISFSDLFERFREGYADCCICSIEDVDYPEETTAGGHPQQLLISYTDTDGSNVTIVSEYHCVEKVVSGSKKMYLWRFTLTEDQIATIESMQEDGTFSISWYAIWNTRTYTGDDDIIWNPVWYWQDLAFTDGSFTDDEMAEYFQLKYVYWASYVNHYKLSEKFEELETLQESVEELQESVDAVTSLAGDVSNIICWGDSLTAGGGWTELLATLSGLTVYNAGVGGESARTIMARQGGDVMVINDITIPAECESVTIATYADDKGIKTQGGYTVTPCLRTDTGHMNPVKIGDIEGTLEWTGETYSDTTGTWIFTRSEAGDEVAITRPTAIRTAYDRNHNAKNDIMVIFMGQNGGYNSDVSELIRMHRLMIDHFKGKEYVILGLSSGTASSRADYEEAMEEEFGRRFISLREYLSYPIYDDDGETIISCYGLDDAGLDATDDDITAIESGQVPSSLLSDSVHYTSDTKTVIGTMLYKKMVELGIL